MSKDKSESLTGGSGVHIFLVLWKAARAVQTYAEKSITELALCGSDFGVLEALLHKVPLPVNEMVKEALRTEETQTNKGRTVAGIVNSIETLEGGGFLVRRPFPKAAFSDFDPFLLLDEMGPMDVAPGEAKGAPDHPHRGFETVTYVLSGEMEHKDSAGNAGSLGPGDVQWMTAGDGVVHSEMPSRRFQSEGGTLHGFQLWVNLPARDT